MADMYSCVHQSSERRCHRSTGSTCIRIGFELLYAVVQLAQHRSPKLGKIKRRAPTSRPTAHESHQTELARELEQFQFLSDGRSVRNALSSASERLRPPPPATGSRGLKRSKRHFRFSSESRITEGPEGWRSHEDLSNKASLKPLRESSQHRDSMPKGNHVLS